MKLMLKILLCSFVFIIVCGLVVHIVRTSDRVDALVTDLQNGDMEKKIEAIEELGALRSDRAIDALVDTLSNDNAALRSAAAAALGNLNVQAPFLDEVGERELAVNERIIAPLTAVLHDSDERVRIAAATALGNTASPQVVCPLTSMRPIRWITWYTR